jgi:hypothetical protein
MEWSSQVRRSPGTFHGEAVRPQWVFRPAPLSKVKPMLTAPAMQSVSWHVISEMVQAEWARGEKRRARKRARENIVAEERELEYRKRGFML